MATGQRTVGIIFALSILPTCFLQTVESPFQIRLTNRITNTITLQCRLTATDQPIPNAMFFLNGTRLENFTELQLDDDHGASFQIRRDLEGYFTCGNDSSMSNPMALITIPDSMLLPNPPPVYTILDEQVKLNCIIPPGQLLQKYSVTWDRAGTVIYQSRNSPPTLNDRYSIDPSDFSLIIDNVQLEDASEAYHCLLTVADPNAMQTYEYTNLQFYDIQLIVLADPVINEPPSDNVTTEGHNASFTCSVRGFPAPVVEWELNGMVLSSDSSTNRTHQDGHGYMITSSTLMLTQVTFDMNGEVRCIGRVPSTETGDRVLDEANSTTTLVVYSPPYIEESKLRNRIIAEGDNTSFVCCARGFPPPMVTWFLNGTPVLPLDPGNEVYERSSQNGPYNVTTSELLITSAQQKLNAKVQCLARSTSAVIDLPDTNATAELVVLGHFGLRVDVTQREDVLFEVSLPTPLSTPIRLTMEYIDLDNLFRRKNVTTTIAYIATTSFLHLESSSRVPFDRFQVSVRLTSKLRDGPAVQDINDHAKNQPTLVDPNVLELEKHKHIIWGAVLVAALFGVSIILLLCCVSCLCYKLKLKQIILNDPNEVLRIYMNQIKDNSIPEDFRKQLIEQVGELANNIVQYHKERQSTTSATRVHNGTHQEGNAIELSEVTNEDALGGPPPPPLNNGENRTQSDYESKEIEDITESPVDEALNAFVAKYGHG